MMKSLCPKCGKNNFLPILVHVFNRSSRPEARQWQCSSCRTTLRLTLESAMKIWITGITGILILALALNLFQSAIPRLSVSPGKVWMATFVLILLDFCLATCLVGKIEIVP